VVCRLILLLSVLAVACGGQTNPGPDLPDIVPGETMSDAVLEVRVAAMPFDWCDPLLVPDADCFAAKREPGSSNIALALAIAQKQIEHHPADSLAWNWEEAVMLLGFLELYKVTGDEFLLDYCKGYLDHHIAAGYKMGTSDTCAPAGVAVWLHHFTGNAAYFGVAEDALTYLYEEASRTEEGGISHLGIVDIVTIWVDSLFMFGNVFMGWHETTGDTDSLTAMGEQFAICTNLLQSDGGFYTHAHQWIVEQTPDVYWSRGNGWVAVAGASYLRLLAMRQDSDAVALSALRKLVDAAIAMQDPETGLWWTILNRPGEAYLETSGAALFAFGMARGWRYGWLDDSVRGSVDAAMVGVLSRISEDGEGRPVVSGISGPTTADKLEVYLGIPVKDDLPFGIGAVILALVETSGLPEAE
jgi:unsaturated rhamnogalacturonyl hydrolase